MDTFKDFQTLPAPGETARHLLGRRFQAGRIERNARGEQ